MASPAQIAANRRNAASSTGPRTPAGKSRSAANAMKLGLFTLRDVIQPGEEDDYASLTAELWRELSPEGPIEQTLAVEIMRAVWRLQRCSAVEARLGDADADDDSGSQSAEDPMASPAALETQSAVDRSRLQSHRILQRSMAELRRIQSERQFRHEVLPKNFNTETLGLASYTEIMGPMAAEARWKRLNQQIDGLTSIQSVISASLPPVPASAVSPDSPAKRTQSAPAPTPRSAPCPCGSGQKYKRCCGLRAEPALCRAA